MLGWNGKREGCAVSYLYKSEVMPGTTGADNREVGEAYMAKCDIASETRCIYVM